MAGYLYILANRRNGATYTGVTSDIAGRMMQHRERAGSAHARKYDIYRLVYVEPHEDLPSAITREKQVKKWLRGWKVALIERDNPRWRDLFHDLNRCPARRLSEMGSRFRGNDSYFWGERSLR